MRTVSIPKYADANERRNAWLAVCSEPLSTATAIAEAELPDDLKALIAVDTARSFYQFRLSLKDEVVTKRKQLKDLLVRIFTTSPHLHYYQGFHDVCSVVLLALPFDEAFHVVTFLTRNHLKDLMQSDFKIIHSLIAMMFAIVEKDDPSIAAIIKRHAIDPIFAVSWMLTMFAHDLTCARSIMMLFDFFLANHPIAIIYASAAVPLLLHSEIVQLESDVSSEEVLNHQWLKEAPTRVPVSLLISHTERLLRKHPLDGLAFKGKSLVLASAYGDGWVPPQSGILSRTISRNIVLGGSLLVLILGIYMTHYYYD